MATINFIILSFLTTISPILSKSDDLIIAKTDIVHATSGLILQYKSTYRPANKVITFSATIPMTADMCYLVPVSVLKKIPRCNLTTDMVNFLNRNVHTTKKSGSIKRNKRFLTDIISIGIGSAALALSARNTIQIANLNSEMKAITESLKTFQKAEYGRRAQILQLTEGQLKLAMELSNTQQALNRTMELVNEHSDILRNHDEAIRTIGNASLMINNKLNAFIHNVEGQFLHTSIEDILNDKLNLHFIHPQDLLQLIQLVIQATNISIDESDSSISLVELVTRLLVQQQIDFIPTIQLKTSPYGVVIGKLLITSFFASSTYDQNQFFVYEPIPIPFNFANKRVRLAQMPAYIGIQPDSRQFVRWTKEEATPCHFELMTSCRVTPAIRKDLEDTCIYQILTDSSLTACRIEPYPESIFIRKIGHYWAVSTNSTTKCHSIKISDSDQHTIMDNHEITIPPIALVSTVDSTSLTCDCFFLPGLPIKLEPKIVLYQNATSNPIDEELIDLHSLIHNNTNWNKLPYIPSNIQTIIDLITNTTKPPEILFWGHFQTHSTLSFTMIMIGIVIVLISFQIYHFRFKKNRGTKVTLNMPSWKTLEQLQQLGP